MHSRESVLRQDQFPIKSMRSHHSEGAEVQSK